MQRIARRAWPALLMAVGAACPGCSPGSAVVAPDPTPAAAGESQTDPPAPPVGPLVEVTPRAARSVREAAAGLPVAGGWALRLEASWPKGVCSPQQKLDIDTNPPSAADHAFESGGLRVVVLKRQVEMLRGARIDYGEKDGRQGFIVTNPNFEGELLKKWGRSWPPTRSRGRSRGSRSAGRRFPCSVVRRTRVCRTTSCLCHPGLAPGANRGTGRCRGRRPTRPTHARSWTAHRPTPGPGRTPTPWRSSSGSTTTPSGTTSRSAAYACPSP